MHIGMEPIRMAWNLKPPLAELAANTVIDESLRAAAASRTSGERAQHSSLLGFARPLPKYGELPTGCVPARVVDSPLLVSHQLAFTHVTVIDESLWAAGVSDERRAGAAQLLASVCWSFAETWRTTHGLRCYVPF